LLNERGKILRLDQLLATNELQRGRATMMTNMWEWVAILELLSDDVAGVTFMTAGRMERKVAR
jgi:hypothetical protein